MECARDVPVREWGQDQDVPVRDWGQDQDVHSKTEVKTKTSSPKHDMTAGLFCRWTISLDDDDDDDDEDCDIVKRFWDRDWDRPQSRWDVNRFWDREHEHVFASLGTLAQINQAYILVCIN